MLLEILQLWFGFIDDESEKNNVLAITRERNAGGNSSDGKNVIRDVK